MTDIQAIVLLGAIGIIWWLIKRNNRINDDVKKAVAFVPTEMVGDYPVDAIRKLGEKCLKEAFLTRDNFPEFDDLLNRLVDRAKEVITSDDPFQANRTHLGEAIYEFSHYEVLSITTDMEKFILQHPAISGELQPHLIEIIKADKNLYATFKNSPESEWEGRISARLQFAHAWMNFHYRLRAYFDDAPTKETDRDWFRSAVMSACIWTEDRYRTQANLPRLVKNNFEGLMYVALLNRVIEGHRDPLVIWEEQIKTAQSESDTFKSIRLVGCH